MENHEKICPLSTVFREIIANDNYAAHHLH